MKKRYFGLFALAVVAIFMLCACTRSTYTQEDIGDPPEVIDETTVLGRWYFEGNEEAYIDFYEDGTYVTNNDGKEGNGTYSFSDDYMTIHLVEESTEVDEEVSVMYGENILYFIWPSSREQIFTNYIIEEDE